MGPQGKGLGRRGATAVFVGVALAALLGMVSLAVDVGMLMKWRSDAQRAADAAALAGAQEFRDRATPDIARITAADSAIAYAARNYVGWRGIDTTGKIFIDSGANRIVNSPEAYVQVLRDERKVRVFIRRAQNPTWFGKLLGWDFVPISVKAAAVASQSGIGKCVKPFAIPDLWFEATSDANGNRVWDTNEGWVYQPPTDRFSPWNPDSSLSAQALQTGYGSTWRNANGMGITNDYGMQITIKAQSPQDNLGPGFFYPWRMPLAAGGTSKGANDYKDLLEDTNCSLAAPTDLSQTYRIEDGNMVGPTRQAIKDLMKKDPSAYWDPSYPDGEGRTGAIRGSSFTNWRDSPRVFVLSLFDPAQIALISQGKKSCSGGCDIHFSNLALFFLEGLDDTCANNCTQAPVKGRFLYFVHTTGPSGPVAGSLIKNLQLVE
jgi:Flp pilus assembly protein TadG